MDPARALSLPDLLGPILPAIVFVLVMSLIREPARQQYNAIFVAGAGAAYLNGGLGVVEFIYIIAATIPAYLGLRSYHWIGVAWLMHTGWDIVHHLYAQPIWHWAPKSSAGCAVMDTLIAIWFFAGAPSVYAWLPGRSAASSRGA